MEGNKEKKSSFTVRSALKLLALICFIIVFCPVFTVSCSGQSIGLSAVDIISGTKDGEKLPESSMVPVLFLLIPIIMMMVLFIKKATERTSALIVCITGAVDAVVWISVRSAVKDYAEGNGCGFGTTGWFLLNMLSLALIIIASALVVGKVLQLDTDLLHLSSSKDIVDAARQVSIPIPIRQASVETWEKVQGRGAPISNAANSFGENTIANVPEARIAGDTAGVCPCCGRPLELGDLFCTWCGEPVPKDVSQVEDSTKASNQESDIELCPECGERLSPEALFCESCGARVREELPH